MLLREARYSDIERYVAELSAPIQKESGIETMRIHARMLDLAGQAPAPEVLDSRLAEKPDDPEAGLQRAAVAMVQDDYAVALAHLLRVLRTDRDYADQLARRAMSPVRLKESKRES